jgi:hypothetical protein
MMYALNSGGFVRQGIFNLVNMSAYNVAIGIWLAYSLSRQAVRATAVNHSRPRDGNRALLISSIL